VCVVCVGGEVSETLECHWFQLTAHTTSGYLLCSEVVEDSNSAVPVVELDHDYLYPNEVDDRCPVADNTADAKETAPDAHMIGIYEYFAHILSYATAVSAIDVKFVRKILQTLKTLVNVE